MSARVLAFPAKSRPRRQRRPKSEGAEPAKVFDFPVTTHGKEDRLVYYDAMDGHGILIARNQSGEIILEARVQRSLLTMAFFDRIEQWLTTLHYAADAGEWT